MFVNSSAYIISLKTGKELITDPIDYFASTNNIVLSELNNPLYNDQYVNMEEVCNHDRDIINSFAQKYEYYKDYRDELKQFFIEVLVGGI